MVHRVVGSSAKLSLNQDNIGNVIGRAHNVGRNVNHNVRNYRSTVNHGDSYNAPIHGCNVGGRSNYNVANNRPDYDPQTFFTQQPPSDRQEQELAAKLEKILAQIEVQKLAREARHAEEAKRAREAKRAEEAKQAQEKQLAQARISKLLADIAAASAELDPSDTDHG